MTDLRLALITRRFWPLVGGAESVMANLASEFHRQGNYVELATARWDRSWPSEVVHREVKVTRLSQPKTRGWGTARYMHSLGSWLRRESPSWDGVLVSMLKHDAHVAVHFGRKNRVPIVARAEGAGETGDCHWHTIGRFGMRIREKTKGVDAWIAPSAAVRDELVAAGFPEERGNIIPNGVGVPAARSLEMQGNARVALAEAHPVLTVGPREPLAVFTGRLHGGKGLLDLIEAWRAIVSTYPAAKLWLVGEGPQGPELWERICQLDLNRNVIMPGSFDELTDVLYAADLFILPSYEEGMSMSLLEAMAAGLPVAVSDIEANRKLIEHERSGLLFQPRRPDDLQQAVERILGQSSDSEIMGQAARQRVIQDYSVQRMAERHLDIFRQLREQPRTSRSDASA